MAGILIVDQHLVLRQGLKRVLRQEIGHAVFGEARTAGQALVQIAKRTWELIVLGIELPDQDGFYVLQRVRERGLKTPILILSTYSDPTYISLAFESGASAYLPKSTGVPELVYQVKEMLAGRTSPGASDVHAKRELAPLAQIKLSPREHSVMLALAGGKQPSVIAAELKLSVKTVSTYKSRIFSKLHVDSLADMIRYLVSHPS